MGRREGHLLGALFVSGALALTLAACGVTFSQGPTESEIFRDLAIEGDLFAGGSVTLMLEYEQPYPVGVPVVCGLIPGEAKTAKLVTPRPVATPPRGEAPLPDTVLDLVSETLAANPEPQGGPVGEATPEAGTIEQTFSLPDLPGRYVVHCFTPRDNTNTIGQLIIVAAPPTPAATATPTPPLLGP